MELIPPLSLTIIFLGICRIKKLTELQKLQKIKKWSILFILIGLSASIPLMISIKQSRYYLVPSFPYFALGLAKVIAPGIYQLINQINIHSRKFRYWLYLTLILLISVTTFSILQFNKIERDKDLIKAVYEIGRLVPQNKIMSICPSIWQNWLFHAYFARYFNISLEGYNAPREYLITDSRCNNEVPLEKYERINLKTKYFELCKRK